MYLKETPKAQRTHTRGPNRKEESTKREKGSNDWLDPSPLIKNKKKLNPMDQMKPTQGENVGSPATNTVV